MTRPLAAVPDLEQELDGLYALPLEEFTKARNDLAARLKQAGVHFGIDPGIRFQGQVGEQATMFFQDPSGNALEFKAFRDTSRLFAK